MERGPIGAFESGSPTGGEAVRAFIPRDLPPHPPLQISATLRKDLDEALLALGRLDSVIALLPDTALFLYMYVRKEAVLSSQIEGTRSTLSDLLLFEIDEAPGVPLDDVQEVSRYVAALDHGLKRLAEGFPLSNRLLCEIHAILLAEGRGAANAPGEFRRTLVWIGGTRPGNAVFVPPPADRIPDGMASLERFLHDQDERTSPVIKAALAHLQFETIHPFLDGNGRVGRLLVTLLFCAEKVLQAPLLYLSLYLRVHRDEYFRLLQHVRDVGDWEAWVSFFAQGVTETATAAVDTAQRLATLFKEDRARTEAIGRAAGSALRVHHALQQRPVLSIAKAAELTSLTVPTVTASMGHLERLGIVKELTGKQRGRLFGYARYIDLLNEGTGG